MNYGQPNYYTPSAYNSGYNGYNYQFNQQLQQPVVPQQQTQLQQPQTLFGKIVDCFETAKSQDLPIGMSGIYPQADGRAIYLKKWLENGTTVTDTYQLVDQTSVKEEKTPTIDWSEKLDNISDRINDLNKKLDKIKVGTTTTTKKRRTEVDEDDDA